MPLDTMPSVTFLDSCNSVLASIHVRKGCTYAEAIGTACFTVFECRKYGTLHVTNSSIEPIVGNVCMTVVTPTVHITIRKEATGSSFTVPVLSSGTMSDLMPMLGIMAVLPGETMLPVYNARMQETMEAPLGPVTDYVFPIVIRVAPMDSHFTDVDDVEARWPYPVTDIVRLPMKDAVGVKSSRARTYIVTLGTHCRPVRALEPSDYVKPCKRVKSFFDQHRRGIRSSASDRSIPEGVLL
jgi:hypothetical protein